MGVPGLLQLLRPICSKGHIKSFAGMRVGVDAYSWLHKGAHSCAMEICTDTVAKGYINYFKNRLQMLLHYNVIPVVIFDGDRLPMKSGEESERRNRRAQALEKGKKALAEKRFDEADEAFRRAIDITPSMAYEVIKICRQLGVEYIVAPYEADAQLAYLSLKKKIAAVISEDSDLFVYGVSKLVLKLDKFGQGELLDTDKLTAMRDPDFTYFSRDMVVYMCVLAGCDFFEGIKGVGVKTAHNIVRRYKTFDRLVQVFRYSSKYKNLPQNFEKTFRRASMVFSHQRVFDPDERKVVYLRDLGASLLPCDDEPDFEFLGPDIPGEIAQAIAAGKLDPITRKQFEETPLNNQPPVAKLPSSSGIGKHLTMRAHKVQETKKKVQTMDDFIVKKGQSINASLVKPFRPPRRVCREEPVKDAFARKRKVADVKEEEDVGNADAESSQGGTPLKSDTHLSLEYFTPTQGSSKSFESPFFKRKSSKRISLPPQNPMNIINSLRMVRRPEAASPKNSRVGNGESINEIVPRGEELFVEDSLSSEAAD